MNTKLCFKKGDGLVPAIIQDYQSGVVYMLGYMNEEAVKKTVASKQVYFWSRSKCRLWMKGETSKNILQIVELYTDCDKDTLLIKVRLVGTNACHTGNITCFYTKL